jgi:hypothetical protein
LEDDVLGPRERQEALGAAFAADARLLQPAERFYGMTMRIANVRYSACMCGRARRPNRRRIALSGTQISGEVASGAGRADRLRAHRGLGCDGASGCMNIHACLVGPMRAHAAMRYVRTALSDASASKSRAIHRMQAGTITVSASTPHIAG